MLIKEKQFSEYSFLVIEKVFHEKRILNGLVKIINRAHEVDGSDWKLYCRKNFLWKAPFMKKFFEEQCCLLGYRNLKIGKKINFRTFFQQRIIFQNEKFLWKVWYKTSIGYPGMIKVITMYYTGKLVSLENFPHGQVFSTT